MAKFRKAILKTGTYHSPDGKVEVTPDRLRHWAGEFARMTAAGQVIPIDWDHATDAEAMTPLSLADYEQRHSAAKGIGRLVDFHVAPDGSTAEITLDVRTKRAVEAAGDNTCYVSPVLFPSWRDGAGNDYHDVITHVDFVHHPVDHSQGAFIPVQPVEPGAVACALRMGLSTQVYRFSKEIPVADQIKFSSANPDDGFFMVRLSSDAPADGFFQKGGKTIPITVGGADYLDEDHKPAKGKKNRSKDKRAARKKKRMSLQRMASDVSEEKPPQEKPQDDKKPSQEADSQVVEEDGEYDSIDELLDLLEEFNIRLPDDTDDENLFDRLRTALHTAVAHKEGDGGKDPKPEAKPVAKPDIIQDPGIATMSLEHKALKQHAERQHRETIGNRLSALCDSGRCTPHELKTWQEQLPAVRLSLDAAGKPEVSEVERFISHRESVPKGTFWTDEQRIRMSQVVDPPTSKTFDPSESEVDDLANWALGRGKKK